MSPSLASGGSSSRDDQPLQLRLMLVWCGALALPLAAPHADTTARYSLALLFALAVQARRRPFDQSARVIPTEERDRVSSFPRIVVVAVLCRLIWVIANLTGTFPANQGNTCRNPHAFVSLVSRLAQLLFFTAFSGVLVTWWEVIQAQQRGAVRFPRDVLGLLRGSSVGPPLATSDLIPLSLLATVCRPATVHLLLNFWAFFIVIGLVAVEFYVCNGAVAKRIDDSETIVVAIFYLGLAAGFAAASARLAVEDALRRRVRLVALVCASLFAVRSALFLVRPVLGLSFTGTAERVLYPSFFFTLPELAPSLVVLALMLPQGQPPSALEAAPLLAPQAGRVEHF